MIARESPARLESRRTDALVGETRCTVLDNGLRVVTDPVAGLQSASIGLWVDTGSRYETPAESGISHMLEHMLFKGTARRSARAIAEEIEDVGGHMNAFTTRDHTSFYAKVLSADIPLAVDMLADIAQHSTFAEHELTREREVILQEIGQVEDTPDDIVFDRLQETAFPDQPLGWSILGTAERVASITRDQLVDYWARQYRGGNIVLTAAGDVDHAQIVDLAAGAFAALPSGPAGVCPPASYRGGDSRDPRSAEQLHITLGLPGVAFGDDDYYALQVFSTMLGGSMSSRLFQEVRETRGLAYSIFSSASSHADTGLLSIYAGTSPEAAGTLVEVIAGELGRMTDGGTLSEPEIARARAQLKAGLLMSLESTSARIEQIGRQMLVFGRLLSVEEMVSAVDAVDAEAVARVCRRVLGDGPVSLASVGRPGTLPAPDRLHSLFA